MGNVVLTGNEAFNPSASTTDVSCFGGSNGTVTVNNVNGAAPFRYSINNGLNYQLSNTFTGLVAGTYTVTVVDANGCAGFVTKLITQPLALSVLTNNIQSTCFGASTGAVTITATGGSGGFGYSWTGPAGFTATQANITNLAAGSYSLTVTDKNGCPAVLVAAVPTFNTVTVNATATNIACKGETNASIVLVTAGGTGTGFSYLWNTGVTTQSISNLPAGNYTVSITDIGSGCVVSRSFTITQPATNLSLSALKTNATGCATLGSITAAGAGGTLGYTFKINNGSFQSSGVFNNLYGGDYTVLVRDANGCTVTKLVNITDNGGDAFEGNNSKNQAKPIVIGSMVNARIALATDIADWFRFTTPAGSNGYTLSLTHPSANFTYNVFTGANNSPALVPASTTGTSKTYSLNGNTTYYISVTGGLSFVCYNLMITAPAQLITKNSSGPLKEIPKETSIPESLIAMAFPNPHKGNFNLKLSSPEDGMATIIISNVYGQQLLQKRVAVVKGNLNTILFSNQKTETLFYRITVGTYKASGTIVGGAK